MDSKDAERPDSPPGALEWDEVLPPLKSKPEEQATESSLPEELEPPAPRWLEPEIAWPIAIFAGFLGSVAGIKMGVPGAGALVALICFVPLYRVMILRERTLAAALISIGWLAGIGGGAAGSVQESSFEAVAAVSPGAERFRDRQLQPWLAGEDRAAAERATLVTAAGGFFLLLIARLSAGILSLAGLAVAVSAIGAGAGWFSTRAISLDPAWACFVGIPPHNALAMAGFLLITAPLADRRPLFPLRELDDVRRPMLLIGSALVGFALLLEPFLASAWGLWMSEALG